jgi:hypothetical protein
VVDDLLNSFWNVRGEIFRIVRSESGGITSERLKGDSWIRDGNAVEIAWEGRRLSAEEAAALPA